MTEEIGFLHVFPFQEMFRKNCHGHVVQEGHVRGIQLEGNRVIVDDIDLFHILVVRSVLGTVVRIHDGLDREFHVIGCEILAVVPFDPFFQMKRISTGILVKLPALRQARNYLIVSVMSSQSVKDQNVDFPMLIHGRIDPCIIIASIYQSGSVRIHRSTPQHAGQSRP